MTFESWLHSLHPEIPGASAAAVLKLASDGATLPFIARYRKEATGNLNEVAIQQVIDAKEEWDKLIQRQSYVLAEIDTQGKLTPELRQTIASCFDRDRLEDLYLPFKKKKKTKAALAREAGLEPLADWIWDCAHGTQAPLPGQTLELWALTFRNEEKAINDVAAVLQRTSDILVERLAEEQGLRSLVRMSLNEKGFIFTTAGEKAKPNSKYEKYFTYQESVRSLRERQNSHRYLAIRRGWLEGELSLKIAGPLEDPEFERSLISAFEQTAITVADSPGEALLKQAAQSAFTGYVRPAIENEIHRTMKSVADEVAIEVFAENLRKLLLAPPLGSQMVLAVDPGIRTGCKVALVDRSGSFLQHHILSLQNDEGKTAAKAWLAELLKTQPIEAIGVGNGTAGRETEIFLRAALKESGSTLPVVMVNEAGASVYSASELAREEFPDLDVTVRGAISIARRLQDPLAELVKIDPKSIGVGQYQHDVPQATLKRALERVVESCVNLVGVNLNTASASLLSYVSGIGPAIAKAILNRRTEKGLFQSRQDLLEIPFFTPKTFEQAAGFLRIPDGKNPLDNTGVHPESYGVLEEFLKKTGKTVSDLLGEGTETLRNAREQLTTLGDFTFQDLLEELAKPGRDPRDPFVPFSFRDDIYELKDLKPGLVCPGIVSNVTNFGAFVDIGIHQDGLVHLSQLANRFVRDPREVVSPGDRVEVRVLEVNLEKKQISLTMKRERPAPAPRPKRALPPRRQATPIQPRRPARPPKPKFAHNPFAAALSTLKDKK